MRDCLGLPSQNSQVVTIQLWHRDWAATTWSSTLCEWEKPESSYRAEPNHLFRSLNRKIPFSDPMIILIKIIFLLYFVRVSE